MCISVQPDDDDCDAGHLHASQTRVSPLRERETDNEERWHPWSNLSVALLSAACQWMLAFVCPRRCVTQEKGMEHIDWYAFSHKKAKRKPREHCWLFPSDKYSKTVLFARSLSITTCFVACQRSHSAPRPTSSLSGIKVAVIGVIIQLYADSLSLNPLRSALCHAWLTCLRWCQVLAVSRRLPYATVLLSPPMLVRWLSHTRRVQWQSHTPPSTVNTNKVATVQKCCCWVNTKFFFLFVFFYGGGGEKRPHPFFAHIQIPLLHQRWFVATLAIY